VSEFVASGNSVLASVLLPRHLACKDVRIVLSVPKYSRGTGRALVNLSAFINNSIVEYKIGILYEKE
jgi:hypothetical protein